VRIWDGNGESLRGARLIVDHGKRRRRDHNPIVRGCRSGKIWWNIPQPQPTEAVEHRIRTTLSSHPLYNYERQFIAFCALVRNLIRVLHHFSSSRDFINCWTS
jgi:hypothetical protein